MRNKSGESAHGGDARSGLVSVSVLLEEPRVRSMVAAHSRPIVLDAIRATLDWYRAHLRPDDNAPSVGDIIALIEQTLSRNEQERLRPVVNATGILLHTGLGRAVLPQNAVDALAGLNRCCNLQIDLETGLRGRRNFATEQLLCKLTGAEAAMVVNNNAAATLLVLTALCAGREVIVSRGQLIEIGGSFRLPDCIHQSGATLVEVGTTNKTHLRDYERALGDNTAAIMRVNPSNYRIVGFSKEVPTEELVSLKSKQNVLVIDDLGCGALVDLTPYGLPHEPTVQDSVEAGADLVLFSGDKMIGGPQAGIIVGRRDLIARVKKHPLTRMLRVCKLTDMALEQTLRLFLCPDTLAEKNPTLRMLTIPAQALRARAEKLGAEIGRLNPTLSVEVVQTESATGGGSLPATTIPSWGLAVTAPGISAERLSYRLRMNEPPVIARIQHDEVVLDMRTLLDGEEEIVARALVAIP